MLFVFQLLLIKLWVTLGQVGSLLRCVSCYPGEMFDNYYRLYFFTRLFFLKLAFGVLLLCFYYIDQLKDFVRILSQFVIEVILGSFFFCELCEYLELFSKKMKVVYC